MDEILSLVGMYSIFLFILYIIKKVADYHNARDDENITYNFEDDDDI